MNSLIYFLRSPKSSQVAYTSNIVEMIYKDQLANRFGFDYFRFFVSDKETVT